MKYLHTFENVNSELQIGYYVSVKLAYPYYGTTYNKFLKEHIGIIKDISYNNIDIYVNFLENGTENMAEKGWCYESQKFLDDDITVIAKSKEELEQKLTANKFNL